MFFPVLIFLCLASGSFEKSTPQDDHYVAAVVEYIVSRDVEENRQNYVRLIGEAAQQNADIIVFPELTLTNSSTSFAVPMYGLLQQYPIPALRSDLYDDLLVSMSAAAQSNQIYVVINTRESLDCTQPREDEECPEQKEYVFNTNVVFDRTGAVIDRYRKINLFGEASHTPALKPDLGLFTTDFGVTFGHFICFDLMFQVPAIQVVQKNNIKDVIFTTMWFSELPLLTAVQIQEAYGYTLDVNFLASGANNVRVGSAGSGIYSGKAGALVSIMPGVPTTKLLVSSVPKVPGNVESGNYPGPIYDNPADHDSLTLIRDPSFPAHVTRVLQEGFQEFTISDKEVSCTFRVRLTKRSNTPVRYHAYIKDGTNIYAYRRVTGVAVCALAACESEDPKSCPYRFKSTEETSIDELEIEMTTYRSDYNETLHCDNIEYFPVSFRYNKFPLSPKNFTFTATSNDECTSQCESEDNNVQSAFLHEIPNRKAKVTLKYKINAPQNELVSFGIFGRVFTRDVDLSKHLTVEENANYDTILDQKYQYRAAAFDGVRSFSGVATGGARTCMVIACTDDTKDSCGRRFDTFEENSTVIFEELTIVANMPTPVVIPSLQADDFVVFPLTMMPSIMPLETKDYNYEKTTETASTRHTFTLKEFSKELYTFGLWGRVFDRDGQDATPPVPDSSTVQILSRALFLPLITYIVYNLLLN